MKTLKKFNLIPKRNKLNYKQFKQDETSSSLYSYIENFIPVEIEPDGNCLFRAISKCLYGNEENHLEIRYRVLVELCFRKEEFLSYSQENMGTNWFSMLAPEPDNSNITDEQIYDRQIKSCSKPAEWGTVWHIFGASQAFKINIQQLYPRNKTENETECSMVAFLNSQICCFDETESKLKFKNFLT